MTEPDAVPTDGDPVDGDGVDTDAPDEPFVRPVDRFARSTGGSLIAAGLLGLQNALEGRPDREHPAIVAESPAAKAHDALELILDPDHPERSVVILRPQAPAPTTSPPPDVD